MSEHFQIQWNTVDEVQAIYYLLGLFSYLQLYKYMLLIGFQYTVWRPTCAVFILNIQYQLSVCLLPRIIMLRTKQAANWFAYIFPWACLHRAACESKLNSLWIAKKDTHHSASAKTIEAHWRRDAGQRGHKHTGGDWDRKLKKIHRFLCVRAQTGSVHTNVYRVYRSAHTQINLYLEKLYPDCDRRSENALAGYTYLCSPPVGGKACED